MLWTYEEISRDSTIYKSLIWFWIDDDDGLTYGANYDYTYIISK